MASFLDLANARYSCRKYLDTPVEREKVEQCLEVARLAPSACNSQPWHFLVIDDPALKNRLCDAIFSGIYKPNIFARQAPVLVVVISEKSTFLAQIGGKIRNTQYYLIDIGIAVEHFILQATELGLGTCWMGWFNEKEAKRILGLSKNQKIDIVFPLGYPAMPKPDKKRKSLDEMSSFRSQ